jgi:phosphate transport system substrate-binding protein
VKPVALAADDGEPYYAATVENARLRKYPLTRATWVFVNRRPGHPLDPKIREFLRYVLSSEGQHDVARGGDYLPLTSDVAMAQIRQLQ